MADAPDPGFEELRELVDASFPGLRCLRCGNEQFYMTSDADMLGAGTADAFGRLSRETFRTDGDRPVLTLACTRCGHLEHHMTGILRRAAKPVAVETT